MRHCEPCFLFTCFFFVFSPTHTYRANTCLLALSHLLTHTHTPHTQNKREVSAQQYLLFNEDGDEIEVRNEDETKVLDFLLLHGHPFNEPIAHQGPFGTLLIFFLFSNSLPLFLHPLRLPSSLLLLQSLSLLFCSFYSPLCFFVVGSNNFCGVSLFLLFVFRSHFFVLF